MNGSPNTASTAQLCRSTMVSLPAPGSTVQLQLFGLLGAATLISPGGAELVVEQLE